MVQNWTRNSKENQLISLEKSGKSCPTVFAVTTAQTASTKAGLGTSWRTTAIRFLEVGSSPHRTCCGSPHQPSQRSDFGRTPIHPKLGLVPTSIQNLICLTKSKNFKMNKESNEDGESKKPFLALLAALFV
jgi:hypothetical protein